MITLSLASSSLKKWEEVLAPHSFGYRLKLLSQLLARKFQEQLDPFGLTPFHWVILCCLWQEDGLAISSLSEKLQQVGGTLTGVLNRMEDRGFVVRQQDAQDRRIYRIWLTDAGRSLQETLPPLALALRQQTMKGFSEADCQQFSTLLDQAIKNLS
jgi:MarR family transcriptional regulator, organic hydroperoxide resistance regulator